MENTSRMYPELIILRSTEGGGFPYLSQEAPHGLVIDTAQGAWYQERYSARPHAIGEADSAVFGLKNVVLGVFCLGNFEHMCKAFASAQEIHRRILTPMRS